MTTFTRICTLLIGISLLVFSFPVSAQPSTPIQTPVPSSRVSVELQVLEQIAQRLETISATDATTTNAAVLLLGAAFFVLMIIVLIVVVWVARGGLKPLVDTVHSERQRAVTAEQSETRMQIITDDKERELQRLRTQQAEALQSTAGELKHVATILSGMETSEQAKHERGNAVQAVNEHTDEQIAVLREDLNKAIQALETTTRTVTGVVTKTDLEHALVPVINSLHSIEKRLPQTDKLATAELPATPPAEPPPAPNSDLPVTR